MPLLEQPLQAPSAQTAAPSETRHPDARRRIVLSLISLAVGAFFGILSAFSPGGVFILSVAVCTFFLLRRTVGPEKRRFILALFVIGFCARTLLSLGLDVGSWWIEGEQPHLTGPTQGWKLGVNEKTRMYLRMGDSDYYSQRGYALVQYAKGSREPVVLYRINQYGWTGYVYVIGLFYHLFGYSPYAVKLINCLLGALLGPLVFLLIRPCFNIQVAKWSALVVAFFPSLWLWSASNLKDIPMIFVTLVLLLCFYRMQFAGDARSAFKYGMLCVGMLLLQATIRTVMLSWILAAGLGVTYILTRRFIKPWQILLLLGAVGGSLMLEPVAFQIRRLLSLAFHWHLGFSTTPGLSYQFLPEAFYTTAAASKEWVQSGRLDGSMISVMFKALYHYLLEPIPGKHVHAFRWITLPQIIFWYGALLLSGVGILWSLRRNLRKSLFLLIPMGCLTFVGAMSSGNVGTVFRIRDMVTPLYLIFACVGMWVLLNKTGNPLRRQEISR